MRQQQGILDLVSAIAMRLNGALVLLTRWVTLRRLKMTWAKMMTLVEIRPGGQLQVRLHELLLLSTRISWTFLNLIKGREHLRLLHVVAPRA